MVGPEREVFNQLTDREQPLIAAERQIYFRDVYDHLIRVTDELDTHRELVSGALEASNVNPVDGMISMIALARQFDMQMKMLQSADGNAQQATQLLAIQG